MGKDSEDNQHIQMKDKSVWRKFIDEMNPFNQPRHRGEGNSRRGMSRKKFLKTLATVGGAIGMMSSASKVLAGVEGKRGSDTEEFSKRSENVLTIEGPLSVKDRRIKENYSAVITVNIADGTCVLWSREGIDFVEEERLFAATGRYLPEGEQAQREFDEIYSGKDRGTYDAEKRIYVSPNGSSQNSLTVPSISEWAGAGKQKNFANLGEEVSVWRSYLLPLVLNSDGSIEKSAEQSVFLLHEIPPETDVFSQRFDVLKRRKVDPDSVSVDEIHLTSGCPNLLHSDFRLIMEWASEKKANGEKIAVIFGYEGVSDQSLWFATKTTESYTENPFYGANYPFGGNDAL